ncbi:MAG: hypothetical protein GY778_25670 [bacterium]|nr:hypothetical protein [bacterium]
MRVDRSAARLRTGCWMVALSLLMTPATAWPAADQPPAPKQADQVDKGSGTNQPAASAEPASSVPTGSVRGQITSDSGRPLPKMIVYLASLDPERHFPPPTEPAVIHQQGAKFSPALLAISVNQSVEFRNDEDRPIEHNVFSRSPVRSFDLGLYRPGTSKSVTFDKPGAVRLYCSVHRFMDGVIYVCPTPFFAVVDDQGRYAIEGVAPGAYALKTWQRRRKYREQTQPVTVTAGQALQADLEMSRK